MTTRADVRAAVRRLLEDTSATPLWDDATLNGFLADAARRYGVRVPAERSATVAVTAGVAEIALAPASGMRRIVRVVDPGGEAVPRELVAAADGYGAAGQAWRWWQGSVRLALPASGGEWRVDYLGGRELPGDDATAVEIEPGDEGIVALLAAATALRRRAVEDGKRGLGRGSPAVMGSADAFEREAETLFAARLRRARGGVLSG